VLGLALSYHGLGQAEDTEAILFEMAALLTEVGSEGPFRLLRSCQARLALARDDVDEAGRLLRLVGQDEGRTFPSFVEIPDVTRARPGNAGWAPPSASGALRDADSPSVRDR
jgi:hypothetical protein